MSELAVALPVRRSDLIVRPVGDGSQYVIKDPRSGAYFTLGEQEHFLLLQLDGRQDGEAVCKAFEDRFGEPLPESDLYDFLQIAAANAFLQPPGATLSPPAAPAPAYALPSTPPVAPVPPQPAPKRARQSILYWRKSIFDPDRLFNHLVVYLRFVWTTPFLVLTLAAIVLAAMLAWTNRQDLVTAFASAWRWQTLVLVWGMLILVTLCHEFAHGLTCKHYGGEVHEVGFLLMFFLPCFYCNVSDAWLIREKWKRLWITLAGGYCDLCLWAAAVFVWRLTLLNSLFNYLAYVLLSMLGARVLFNFMPLVKLDGYYLLSDWLEIPNLQLRAREYLFAHLRRLLWGARRPAADPWGKLLVVYGAASWLFSLGLLVLMLVGIVRFLGESWRLVGITVVVVLALLSVGSFFQGLSRGEIHQMAHNRPKRVVLWLLILAAVPLALSVIPFDDRSSGPFLVRPSRRVEVRAPVAGFLASAPFDEGDQVQAGTVVAQLEVPDLTSRIAQKRAELREAHSKLLLLEAGPRQEEVQEQQNLVEHAECWCRQAEHDRERARRALNQELDRLDRQIAQYQAQQEYTRAVVNRYLRLRQGGAASEQEYQEALKQLRVDETMEQQTLAQKRALQEKGVLEAEMELGRRKKELVAAKCKLSLLKLGARAEEIEAEQARQARLEAEASYLDRLQHKLQVRASAAGIVTTPHLREKVGQYLHEGDLICVIEELSLLEAEIALSEQDMGHVEPDQEVELKVRALPYQTFRGRVSRIAPAAVRAEPLPGALGSAASRSDTPGTVTVCCYLEEGSAEVRPGMTGYARVYSGKRSVGAFLVDRALRYLRTEFWW